MKAKAAILVATLLLIVGDWAGVEAATKQSRRRIVVLEFRAGASGAPNLAWRMATVLRGETSLQVSDMDDARRALGDRLDAEVARCAGDPTCVAKLGRRLDVNEVLLVGVSALGDLIVALSRVDVSSAKVVSRVAESLAPEVEPSDELLKGWLKRLLPPEDFRRFGTIYINTNVAGAEVSIGGKRRGSTPLAPIVVEAPARVDVRVKKPGYVDFTAEIQVPPDSVVEVRPELSVRHGTPWYGKWWVWAAASGLAAGAIVGTVVLTQEAPSSVPVVVEF